MTEYTLADEVAEVAHEVIDEWPPHLDDTDIRYLFRDPMQKSQGKEVWASIRKASPTEKLLSGGAELVLIVAFEAWQALNAKNKRALLDHEFCHVEIVEDEDTGEITYRMVGHDLEEFHAVALRHGPWRDSIRVFAEQLDLFEHAKHNQ